jgi:hypothetical protein
MLKRYTEFGAVLVYAVAIAVISLYGAQADGNPLRAD